MHVGHTLAREALRSTLHSWSWFAHVPTDNTLHHLQAQDDRK